jgi:hypothetical protein
VGVINAHVKVIKRCFLYFLEGLTNTTTNLVKDKTFPGPDFNLVPFECQPLNLQLVA